MLEATRSTQMSVLAAARVAGLNSTHANAPALAWSGTPPREADSAPLPRTPFANSPALLSMVYAVSRVLLVAALVVALGLSVESSAGAYYVTGVSMAPSLRPNQPLLLNRAAYWRVDGTPFELLAPPAGAHAPRFLFGGPRRGDLVVFQSPFAGDGEFVKRVIGLPGETVLVKAGQVFVDGKPLDEPYVAFPDDYTFPNDGRPARVPDAAYFVLGDNRGASTDSHMGWYMPAENLLGQAMPLPLSLGR
jgi:signal peptidase I